jgi:hypothetical protein
VSRTPTFKNLENTFIVIEMGAPSILLMILRQKVVIETINLVQSVDPLTETLVLLIFFFLGLGGIFRNKCNTKMGIILCKYVNNLSLVTFFIFN